MGRLRRRSRAAHAQRWRDLDRRDAAPHAGMGADQQYRDRSLRARQRLCRGDSLQVGRLSNRSCSRPPTGAALDAHRRTAFRARTSRGSCGPIRSAAACCMRAPSSACTTRWTTAATGRPATGPAHRTRHGPRHPGRRSDRRDPGPRLLDARRSCGAAADRMAKARVPVRARDLLSPVCGRTHRRCRGTAPIRIPA